MKTQYDLASEMRQNLRPTMPSAESRMREALHHLDSAAERFDEAGNTQFARMVTDVLVSFAVKE